MVLLEQLRTVNKSELLEYVGTVDDERMLKIVGILSIGKNTAYALVNSGVFHFVKVGGHYRISKKSFDRWLDNMDSESSGCQVCD